LGELIERHLIEGRRKNTQLPLTETSCDYGELEEVAAHGAQLLVVTLSNGIQVYPDPKLRRAYMQQMGLDSLFYPDYRIKALGERHAFAVLNLAPAFQHYADRHHVYLHGFSNTLLGCRPLEREWAPLRRRVGSASCCNLPRQRKCRRGSA
jgi:hypothetical protein